MSRQLALGILSVVMIVAVTATARAPQGTSTASRKVTKEQFEQWKKDLNNWGRWGKDDEIGTMNFITPAKRKQAADDETHEGNSSSDERLPHACLPRRQRNHSR